jgi:hypothetical protein
MPDPLPEKPRVAPVAPAETPESLASEQQKTERMMKDLLEKAHSTEMLKRGKDVAQHLAQLSERLQQLTGRSQEIQIRSAREAIQAFQQRIDHPAWQDQLYQNKEVILAGAAVLTLGAWLWMKKSPWKKWGMTAVAVATGGLIGHQYLNEKSLPLQQALSDLSRRTSAAPGSRENPGQEEKEGQSASRPEQGIDRLEREYREKKAKADRLYSPALVRASDIRREIKAWTEQDAPLFRDAVQALDEVINSPVVSDRDKQAYSAKKNCILEFTHDPSDLRWMGEVTEKVASGVADYLKYSMVFVPVEIIRQVVRRERVGQIIIQAAREGNMARAEQILGNSLRMRDAAFWRTVSPQGWEARELSEEIVRMMQAGLHGPPPTAEYLAKTSELERMGLKLEQAEEIVRRFSNRSTLVRWVLGESEMVRTAKLAENVLAAPLKAVLLKNRQGLEAVLKAFETVPGGGRQLTKFLENINGLQNAEEVLTRLAERGEEVSRLIRLHGPEIAEALIRYGHDAPKFNVLLGILGKVEVGVKMPARGWGASFGKMISDLDKGKTLESVVEGATKGLTRQAEHIKNFSRLGIVVEAAILIMYLREADEIERMASNLRAFGDDERAKVLMDRASTKRLFGYAGAAVGLAIIFLNPSFTVVAAIMAVQALAESMHGAMSDAEERRARSPQAWASERERHNLVKLWTTEHGISDGDWIGDMSDWENREQKLTDGNINTRKNLVQGILVQDAGITDMATGQRVLQQLRNPQEGPTVSDIKDTALLLKFRFDYIENHRPHLDPQNPIEANLLLSESLIYGQLRMEHLRLLHDQIEIEKLKTGRPNEKDGEFRQYVEWELGKNLDVILAGERAEIMTRFVEVRYPNVSERTLKLYSNLRDAGNVDALKQIIASKIIGADVFFADPNVVNEEQRGQYGGLLKLYPLRGSVFAQLAEEDVESLRIRQSLEGRLNELYTLLAMEQQSGRPMEPLQHQQFDQCFSFCQRYYQAVYGVPYQATIISTGLDESRISSWVQSLSLDRSEGVSFDPTKPDARTIMANALISDEAIQINCNVSRQREVQSLYGLARALGYQGQMKKEYIQQYFSEERAKDFGFYFKGNQWVILRLGVLADWTSPDEGFRSWTREQLFVNNILIADENGHVTLKSGLKRPATPERTELLLKSYEGKLPSWEDNPLAVDFLIDSCTKHKADMFQREDDRWYVGNDDKSQAASEKIGQSYSEFLRKQRDIVASLNTLAAREAFQKSLNDFLSHSRAGFTALPPTMVRDAYLAGFDNVGLFAYKVIDGQIHAYQLAGLPNDQLPSFLTRERIDNRQQFEGKQFSVPLQQSIDDMRREGEGHEKILSTCSQELKLQIDCLQGIDTPRKTMLSFAIEGLLQDFLELDRVVYSPDNRFNITPEHKRAFAMRMRQYILRVSELVFQLDGQQDGQKFNQIFGMRSVVGKFKQLYLISFLQKSHVDESWNSFIRHHPNVNEPNDWIRIESDIDSSLSRFQFGNVYSNEKGVQEFYLKEQTELTADLAPIVTSEIVKQEYCEYYLRETSQLIYMANVFGFDTKGNLNTSVPTFQPTLDTDNLRHLDRLIASRRLNFQNWLIQYQGTSPERASEIITFNAGHQQSEVRAFVRDQDRQIGLSRDRGVVATCQARSMLTMCLSFRSLVQELQRQSPQVNAEQFPELQNIVQRFNGSELLNGGVDGMGYTDAFTYDLNKMRAPGAIDNFVSRMEFFYPLFKDSMERGLGEMWNYLSIPKEYRDGLHQAMGDTQINGFTMRRALYLSKIDQKDVFRVSSEGASFRLQFITQDQLFTRCHEYFWNRERGYQRAGGEEREVFSEMKQELLHLDPQAFEDMIAMGKPTPEVDQLRLKYRQTLKALDDIMAKISEQNLRIINDPSWVKWQQIDQANKAVKVFLNQFGIGLTSLGISNYWKENGERDREHQREIRESVTTSEVLERAARMTGEALQEDAPELKKAKQWLSYEIDNLMALGLNSARISNEELETNFIEDFVRVKTKTQEQTTVSSCIAVFQREMRNAHGNFNKGFSGIGVVDVRGLWTGEGVRNIEQRMVWLVNNPAPIANSTIEPPAIDFSEAIMAREAIPEDPVARAKYNLGLEVNVLKSELKNVISHDAQFEAQFTAMNNALIVLLNRQTSLPDCVRIFQQGIDRIYSLLSTEKVVHLWGAPYTFVFKNYKHYLLQDTEGIASRKFQTRPLPATEPVKSAPTSAESEVGQTRVRTVSR